MSFLLFFDAVALRRCWCYHQQHKKPDKFPNFPHCFSQYLFNKKVRYVSNLFLFASLLFSHYIALQFSLLPYDQMKNSFLISLRNLNKYLVSLCLRGKKYSAVVGVITTNTENLINSLITLIAYPVAVSCVKPCVNLVKSILVFQKLFKICKINTARKKKSKKNSLLPKLLKKQTKFSNRFTIFDKLLLNQI